MQYQNAKSTQYKDQQLPYFTNVSGNVTNYPASVLIGDISPRRHLMACSLGHEVGTTTIHRSFTVHQRHTEFAICTSQEKNP